MGKKGLGQEIQAEIKDDYRYKERGLEGIVDFS